MRGDHEIHLALCYGIFQISVIVRLCMSVCIAQEFEKASYWPKEEKSPWLSFGWKEQYVDSKISKFGRQSSNRSDEGKSVY
jgi:hypothetical protein